MTDVWETIIWLPYTPGLGLQFLLPKNTFLLYAWDELLFKDGSVFCWGRKENCKWSKLTEAATCNGRWISLARPTSEKNHLNQLHKVLHIISISHFCKQPVQFQAHLDPGSWVTLVQGSVMCSPGWKCFSTDIKSWIWSRGDFTISGIIFRLYWVWPPLFTKQRDLCQLLLSRKQTGKEGFGFIGLTTNWI